MYIYTPLTPYPTILVVVFYTYVMYALLLLATTFVSTYMAFMIH